jgi:hypothetical protein
MSRVALLEVLDRDGHVKHYLPIGAWPVSAGRALDNDLVLDDPHVAPHHLRIDADESGGVFIEVGDTQNGVRIGGRRAAAGERIAVGDQPLRMDAGDSHLCLRLAQHALTPELPLRTPASLWQAMRVPLAAGVAVLAALLFGTWLDTDPDNLTRAWGSVLVAALTAGATWCAGWSLVSKIFTRRSHFWWHLRVLLLGVLAIEVAEAASQLLAFSLSFPPASDFSFVASYAIGAAMLYFHVLGVEPRRPERMRVVAVSMFVAGTALALWFNHQARDQFGEELYMNHLFPPALRLARTTDSAEFVKSLAPLQQRLDEKAKKRDDGGDSGPDDDN